ncbi:hypothetical protein D3C77_380010 [compost metagenome]
MHMEFVKAQHLAVFEQFIEGAGQGILLLAVLEHALMQPGEEFVKVHAALRRLCQGLKETLQQPAFTAPDRAIQVQAAGLAAGQGSGLGCHLVDHQQLALAQGVALGSGLVVKMLTNGGSAVGVGPCADGESVTQGAQR